MTIKPMTAFKKSVDELFYSRSPKSVWFNWFLLLLNLLAIFLFLLDPRTYGHTLVYSVECFFGVIFTIEYAARFWIAKNRVRFVFSFMGIIDMVVILSLFAPLLMGDFGFLRVIRALRILRAYRAIIQLKADKTGWVARNEDILNSITNLSVFIFVMTDIVFVFQAEQNDQINSYIDALYFTLSTLTTTGFGDITPQGESGKLVTILIMVIGVSLFVRLAQSVFRPQKVHYDCPDCGLLRHDPDAVHCKHCGKLMHIETEGA